MDGKPRVLQYFDNGQVLIDRDIADWLIAERDERIRELTIDLAETERERAKAVELEQNTAAENMRLRRAEAHSLSRGW